LAISISILVFKTCATPYTHTGILAVNVSVYNKLRR